MYRLFHQALNDTLLHTRADITPRIRDEQALTQAFLTLSEVLGHVDLLADEGRVREAPDGDVVRFEAVG